jgi:integrase
MNARKGLGSVYKRGRIWWLSYSVRGKPHAESSGSTEHADAVRKLKQRIKDVGTGRPIGPKIDRTTLGDLLEMLVNDYKANNQRASAIKAPVAHLVEHFGKETLAIDITTDEILKFVNRRRDEGASNSTVNRSLSALKRAFHLGEIAKKVADKPHVPMLAEDNVRQGFVTKAEFERLRAALPADLRDPVAFLYYSAWRVGEVRSLQWRDIKGNSVRLRPENSKNKKGRVLPLRGELAETIGRVTERRVPESPFVFHRDDGRPLGLFRKSWTTACKKAGLGDILVHDLRRSAIKNMMDTGHVRERVAMAISGHKTRSVFDRYDIATEDDMARALDHVTDHLANQPDAASNVIRLVRRN